MCVHTYTSYLIFTNIFTLIYRSITQEVFMRNKMHKSYFIIDQQIVRMSVPPLPFYATQIIILFWLQGSQLITIKGWDFSQLGNPYTLKCSSSIESLFLKLRAKKDLCTFFVWENVAQKFEQGQKVVHKNVS